MPPPPKPHELNPIENIWQFIRGNWLSNRAFDTYDDIVEHRRYARNRLIDQPGIIMSIEPRDSAHGVLSQEFGVNYYRNDFSRRCANILGF